MALIRTFGLALVLALGVTAAAAAAPASVGNSCDRIVPTISPEWAIGGTFQGSDTLLLADSMGRQLIRYDLGNRGASGRVEGHLASSLARLGPVSVAARTSGGFAVLLETSELLFLDQWMRPENVRDVRKEMGVAAFVPMAVDPVGDALIACGDMQRQEGDEWISGFFEIPLRDPADFRSLYEFDAGENAPFEKARLLNCQAPLGPYVAVASGQKYVLIVGERPQIFRVTDGAEPLVALNAFPTGFTERPKLPDVPFRGEYWTVMNAIQFANLPVALIGQEGYLYVVTRSPAGGGASTWQITKIDPKKDEVVGTANLPTDQAHLVPIAGPSYWAFLEKGPAGGWDDPHKVESILVVPSQQIRGISGGETKQLCR